MDQKFKITIELTVDEFLGNKQERLDYVHYLVECFKKDLDRLTFVKSGYTTGIETVTFKKE
jgi:hypothetical protein